MRNDRGDSLVEILAALAILSIGVVGLLTALAAQVSTTVTNRNQTQASTTLLATAEYVKGLPFSTFGSCSGSTTIVTTQVPHDATFAVAYGPAVAVGSTPCADLVSVPVTVTGDGFALTINVVRRP